MAVSLFLMKSSLKHAVELVLRAHFEYREERSECNTGRRGRYVRCHGYSMTRYLQTICHVNSKVEQLYMFAFCT